MMRIGCCLAVLGGLALAPGQTGEKKTPFAPTVNEVKVFELTNLERKKKDLAPLKLSPLLCAVARKHSENMARQGKMEHKLDGKAPANRARAAGYQFVIVGENIAVGDAEVSLPDLMEAWMASKKHQENILFADYTEIGVGIASDKEGQVYYTQLFAQPKK